MTPEYKTFEFGEQHQREIQHAWRVVGPFLVRQDALPTNPVQIGAYNYPKYASVPAMYHGLFRFGNDDYSHFISLSSGRENFPFLPDQLNLQQTMVHEIAHALHREYGDWQEPQPNPFNYVYRNIFDEFVSREFRLHQQAGSPTQYTLADVMREGFAKYAERLLLKDRAKTGTIFDRIAVKRENQKMHTSSAASVDLMRENTEIDAISLEDLGCDMFGRYVSRTQGESQTSLRTIAQLDVNYANGFPLYTIPGEFNPDFLHYYHHPEEIPLAPLRT